MDPSQPPQPRPEPSRPAGLYAKLAAIAGAIAAVEKDGRNADLGYRYVSPASVMSAVKPLLAAQQLALIPHLVAVQDLESGQRSGAGKPFTINRVLMHYHILDGASGETLIVPWQGQAGSYGDDKGLAKAQTVALRTFLIQLFQIPAEDPETDPDARDPWDRRNARDTRDGRDTRGRGAAPRPRPRPDARVAPAAAAVAAAPTAAATMPAPSAAPSAAPVAAPAMPPAADEAATVDGVVARVQQWYADGGAARLQCFVGDTRVLAQDALAETWFDLEDGETVQIAGPWKVHPKVGRYLAATAIARVAPAAAPVAAR